MQRSSCAHLDVHLIDQHPPGAAHCCCCCWHPPHTHDTEDAIKAAVKDIKAKRSQGNESHSDSEAGGHKAEATA